MVQIAVVSVRPYTCSTGIPIIMKKSCVSTASGAEPQISAFRFGPMLLRIVGNISEFASESQNESARRRCRVSRLRSMRCCAFAKNRRGESAALLNRFLDFAPHAFEQRRDVQEIIRRGDLQFIGELA